MESICLYQVLTRTLQPLVTAAHAKGVKVHVSIGGANSSGSFSTVVANAQRRATFVTDLENIFKMFYRADETSKGSGLGLYIVKETIDKLKGKIDVDSIKNEGTIFTLTLPSIKPKG